VKRRSRPKRGTRRREQRQCKRHQRIEKEGEDQKKNPGSFVFVLLRRLRFSLLCCWLLVFLLTANNANKKKKEKHKETKQKSEEKK
jgi:hypothetical protein